MTANRNPHTITALATSLALCLTFHTARAVNLYWDADGNGGAGVGGTETWDTATSQWRSGGTSGALQTWTNNSGSPDVAFFPATAGTVTLAGSTTFYLNGLNFQTNGYVLAGASGSKLSFLGTDPAMVSNGGVSATVNALLDVGSGLRVSMNGGTLTLNNSAGNQLTGSGPVSLFNPGYGVAMTLNYSQAAFTGGFALSQPTTRYRQTTLNANVAGSMGTGASTGTASSRFAYVWGAQAVGGASDGGAAGVTVASDAIIDLSGTHSASLDRFTVNANGILRGSSAQLGSISRVGSFTDYASQTAPEAVLNAGAIISHTAASTSSVQNLGTNRDLYFGLGANFNDAAFNLTIGANTPWLGLAKDSSAMGDYTQRRLQKGIIAIDDGGGTVTEIVLRSLGKDYDYNDNILYLGNGADSPVFTTVPGGGKVAARIVKTNNYGEVWLDSSTPQYSGGIDRFLVGGTGEGGELVVSRAAGLGGVPVEVQSGGMVRATVSNGFDANVTVKAGGFLYADRALDGAGTLTVESGALVTLATANGLAGSQGASGVQAGAIVQFAINDPQALGQTAPGAILEYNSSIYGHRSLGGLDGTGQILTRNPENYNGSAVVILDSATDGIGGTLTICAPSTGSYPGKFEIRENFEAGAVVTIGHTDPAFTVRGYQQKSYVYLNNAANDMSKINVAGAGVNGGTILYIDNPASLGSADIEFIVPTSVDAGGSRVELTGDQTGTFYYLNHWQVADNSRGILYHQRYQGSRVAVLGDITLGANARLDLTRNWSNTFSFAGNITLGPGAQLQPIAGQTLEVAAGKTLAGSGSILSPVSTNSSVTLAPGNSPGTLAVGGNLTLGASNTYQWEIDADGNADLIAVSGNLTIPDDFTIEIIPLAKGSSGDFDLFSYTGTFIGSPSAWTVNANGMPYTEIIDTGSAIRITGLVQIPEPASLSLLALSAIALLRRRRG